MKFEAIEQTSDKAYLYNRNSILIGISISFTLGLIGGLMIALFCVQKNIL
jgi:hypothetical protein